MSYADELKAQGFVKQANGDWAMKYARISAEVVSIMEEYYSIGNGVRHYDVKTDEAVRIVIVGLDHEEAAAKMREVLYDLLEKGVISYVHKVYAVLPSCRELKMAI